MQTHKPSDSKILTMKLRWFIYSQIQKHQSNIHTPVHPQPIKVQTSHMVIEILVEISTYQNALIFTNRSSKICA